MMSRGRGTLRKRKKGLKIKQKIIDRQKNKIKKGKKLAKSRRKQIKEKIIKKEEG